MQLSIGQIIISRVTYNPIEILTIYSWGIKGRLVNWVKEDQPFHLQNTDGISIVSFKNIITE